MYVLQIGSHKMLAFVLHACACVFFVCAMPFLRRNGSLKCRPAIHVPRCFPQNQNPLIFAQPFAFPTLRLAPGHYQMKVRRLCYALWKMCMVLGAIGLSLFSWRLLDDAISCVRKMPLFFWLWPLVKQNSLTVYCLILKP